MKKKIVIFAVLVALVSALLLTNAFCVAEEEHKLPVLNEDNPGGEVNIEEYLIPGKINVIDFYAEWCSPCRNITPYLEELDATREDLVVLKINIKEWDSPVCQQYGINSVPNFMIYNEEGKLAIEGDKAWDEVMRMLNELEGEEG